MFPPKPFTPPGVRSRQNHLISRLILLYRSVLVSTPPLNTVNFKTLYNAPKNLEERLHCPPVHQRTFSMIFTALNSNLPQTTGLSTSASQNASSRSRFCKWNRRFLSSALHSSHNCLIGCLFFEIERMFGAPPTHLIPPNWQLRYHFFFIVNTKLYLQIYMRHVSLFYILRPANCPVLWKIILCR